MTDAPELKPCPFCGGKAGEPWFDDEDGGSERGEVYCTGCPASTQGSHQGWMRDESDLQQSINQAITAWNTRADLAKPRVKPLVWGFDGSVHYADGVSGEYNFTTDDIHIDEGFYLYLNESELGNDNFYLVEEAKAAAQADYEARVLACLEGYGDALIESAVNAPKEEGE